MNRFKNQLLMAAGFAGLAVLISGITAAPAIAAAVKAALVKNVDEPGRSPFQQTVEAARHSTTVACPIVATNTRLVIQHLNVAAFGAGFLNAQLIINSTNYELNYSTHGPDPGNNLTWIVDSPFLAFVNPGDTCSISMGTYGDTPSLKATFTGYVVDFGI